MVLVLAGEEIPDLLQKMAAEHPDTDPLLAAVNRYHRQEEARHLSFAPRDAARALRPGGPGRALPHPPASRPSSSSCSSTCSCTRACTRPSGCPGLDHWRAVNRTPERLAVRHAATRNILDALLQAGVLRRGRVPRGWRRLCGVDRHGEPVGDRRAPAGGGRLAGSPRRSLYAARTRSIIATFSGVRRKRRPSSSSPMPRSRRSRTRRSIGRSRTSRPSSAWRSSSRASSATWWMNRGPRRKRRAISPSP